MNAKQVAEEIRGILAMPGQKIARSKLATLAENLEATARDDAKRAGDYEKLQTIGRNAAECLADMVAALECDYDRLEELREERKALADDIGTQGQTKRQRAEAEAALEQWDEDNGEELEELEAAAGDCESQDDARQRISEDPLSVEVTFSPCSPGETPGPDGFVILLTTGGPAVRIRGDLDGNNEPRRAGIEAQDWFLPWTEYHGDGIEHDALLTYCRQFYFGAVS
jgi:hypothetical protein